MNALGSSLFFIFIAGLGFWGAIGLKSWLFKVLVFLAGLGAAQFALLSMEIGAGVALLINVLIFVGVGALVLKNRRGAGDILFGVILVVIGLALVLPAFESLGTSVPSTIFDGIAQSFQQGWETFVDMLERAFVSS